MILINNKKMKKKGMTWRMIINVSESSFRVVGAPSYKKISRLLHDPKKHTTRS